MEESNNGSKEKDNVNGKEKEIVNMESVGGTMPIDSSESQPVEVKSKKGRFTVKHVS